MDKKTIKTFEKKIDYKFKNKELLLHALTHKTYAYEALEPIEFNERLELLGDSVLGFVVVEQLYKTNKYFSEGELTRRRATLVNNKLLAKKAKEMDIGKYLFLGKGEQKQNGNRNPTNLANALEAVIGAIYLDSDIDVVRNFILNTIFSDKFEF
jgi:ribonuclease-3